jgi:hypothetical protein
MSAPCALFLTGTKTWLWRLHVFRWKLFMGPCTTARKLSLSTRHLPHHRSSRIYILPPRIFLRIYLAVLLSLPPRSRTQGNRGNPGILRDGVLEISRLQYGQSWAPNSYHIPFDHFILTLFVFLSVFPRQNSIVHSDARAGRTENMCFIG